jgi:hypothetical protein
MFETVVLELNELLVEVSSSMPMAMTVALMLETVVLKLNELLVEPSSQMP